MKLLLTLAFCTAISVAGDITNNTYVRVSVSLLDTTVVQGGTGMILISLVPVDGIHINIDPPLSLKLDRNATLLIKGRPDFDTNKETGYLATSAPIAQRFAVLKKARPGSHHLKGTLVYYFCSDTEGWCRKFTQAITLTLNVSKK